ncbi:MAG: inositol 2-dehydrogenase [Rhodococcus erythropolis]|jgi:myo-inositol 2-dehydrogenase/D-chiro-inositol 1-dehydrogenase|nr:Gfo/Idh/MocA family oxidoreductase [Rhodococcus erythropolis]MDF2894439.1 inositol 2-dehydrogenase [Rhodococcus erythropolis]
MSIRVGVIGTGVMGADHVRNLHSTVSGATVSVVADLDQERAKSVASAVGARWVTDPLKLINDAGVDAVVIASHDSTHADLTLAAVEAGKPVLCEKPLAVTAEDCRLVAAAENPESPLVSVGFMRRFDPGYVALKAETHSGRIGDPLIVHCSSRTVSAYPGGSSESTVTNSAIHELDIVPWILNSPVVAASWHCGRSSSLVTDRQDPQIIMLRTADGVLTTVEVFLNARYGYDTRCEVVGEIGAARLAEPVVIHTDADRSHSYGYAADWIPRFAESYRRQFQEWIDALSTGRPSTLATAADGLRANLVAAAVIKSMHSAGTTVSVEPVGESF